MNSSADPASGPQPQRRPEDPWAWLKALGVVLAALALVGAVFFAVFFLWALSHSG